MAEWQKQAQIRQIHQKLRGNGYNDPTLTDYSSEWTNESNIAGTSTDNPYLGYLYDEESEI